MPYASGPVSKRTVCAASLRYAVRSTDSPWCAEQIVSPETVVTPSIYVDRVVQA